MRSDGIGPKRPMQGVLTAAAMCSVCPAASQVIADAPVAPIEIGTALEADLAAVRAVRKRMPDEVKSMADFNQALTLAPVIGGASAIRESRALSPGVAMVSPSGVAHNAVT